MEKIRLGVVGVAGGMARNHQKYFDKIEGLTFAAGSDLDFKAVQELSQPHGFEPFEDGQAMIDSGRIDAVLIACPHYHHPLYAKAAFDAGVHVLCEKPVAVTAKAAQQTNEAYDAARQRHPGLIFAGMFNMRTQPEWMEIKRLCQGGSLGELMRVSWTITTWFRTQAYYDSGDWRATWSGEGGGVLLNQCPHNLDLFQWFVGMPARVTANVGLGKYHHIEVEDDVTALLEFDNGATGTFTTSTGQSPGVNRLEIVGENGTLIYDGDQPHQILFKRSAEPVSKVCRTSGNRFAMVAHSTMTIQPPSATAAGHEAVMRNFVETILAGSGQGKLIAPGPEMIHGLELGNAMLMSGLKHRSIDLPTDRDAFDRMLDELRANSTFRKNQGAPARAGIGASA